MGETFCPRCDVSMDLHPSTEPWGCDIAGQKADLIGAFDRIFQPQHDDRHDKQEG